MAAIKYFMSSPWAILKEIALGIYGGERLK
jgi:hypothetical protein